MRGRGRGIVPGAVHPDLAGGATGGGRRSVQGRRSPDLVASAAIFLVSRTSSTPRPLPRPPSPPRFILLDLPRRDTTTVHSNRIPTLAEPSLQAPRPRSSPTLQFLAPRPPPTPGPTPDLPPHLSTLKPPFCHHKITPTALLVPSLLRPTFPPPSPHSLVSSHHPPVISIHKVLTTSASPSARSPRRTRSCYRSSRFASSDLARIFLLAFSSLRTSSLLDSSISGTTRA